jgi:hypothetical protein
VRRLLDGMADPVRSAAASFAFPAASTVPAGSSSFGAESRTPGDAGQGVGGAAFAPTSKAAETGPTDKTTPRSEPTRDVKEQFAAVGHGTIDKPASAAPARETQPTESSTTGTAQGHERQASTDTNGKKGGFLAKVGQGRERTGGLADIVLGPTPPGQGRDQGQVAPRAPREVNRGAKQSSSVARRRHETKAGLFFSFVPSIFSRVPKNRKTVVHPSL